MSPRTVVLSVALALAGLTSCGKSPPDESGGFVMVVVDADGPREPWGKTAGDLTGDGLPDLVVGGNGSGELTSTDWEPGASLYAAIPKLIEEHGILDASVLIGYAWADADAPRFQLEPMGYGGYIEGRPVRPLASQ